MDWVEFQSEWVALLKCEWDKRLHSKSLLFYTCMHGSQGSFWFFVIFTSIGGLLNHPAVTQSHRCVHPVPTPPDHPTSLMGHICQSSLRLLDLELYLLQCWSDNRIVFTAPVYILILDWEILSLFCVKSSKTGSYM